jgi:hypothetical protein
MRCSGSQSSYPRIKSCLIHTGSVRFLYRLSVTRAFLRWEQWNLRIEVIQIIVCIITVGSWLVPMESVEFI